MLAICKRNTQRIFTICDLVFHNIFNNIGIVGTILDFERIPINQGFESGHGNILADDVPISFFDELTIRTGEHIIPRNQRIADAGVVVEIFLEASADASIAIVIRGIESFPKLLEHILAIVFRLENLMFEQVLDDSLLLRVLVILRDDLAIGNALDSLSANLAFHCLSGTFGERVFSRLIEDVHIMRNAAEHLMVTSTLRLLRVGSIPLALQLSGFFLTLKLDIIKLDIPYLLDFVRH